jgi:hypothetical protein
MDKIRDYAYSSNTSPVTSHTGVLPDYVAGDLLIWYVVKDGAAGGALPVPSGYTELTLANTSNASALHRFHVFYKIASGSEAAPNTTTSSADEFISLLISIKDVPGSAYIDASNDNNDTSGSARFFTFPAVTTTTNDCLLLHLYSMDASRRLMLRNCAVLEGRFDETINVIAGYSYKQTAGPTTPPIVDFDLMSRGASITIAIKSSNTDRPMYEGAGSGGVYHHGAKVDPTPTSISGITVNGPSVTGLTANNIADSFFTGVHPAVRIEVPQTKNLELGGVQYDLDGGGKDFSVNKHLLIYALNSNLLSEFETIDNAGFVIGVVSGSAWRCWKISGSDEKMGLRSWRMAVIDVTDTSDLLDSSGTFDESTLSDVFILHRRKSSSTTTIRWWTGLTAVQLRPMVFLGGTAAEPITTQKIGQYMENKAVLETKLQGNVQLLSAVPLQFGDGTNDGHYDLSSSTIEYLAQSKTGSNRYHRHTDNFLGTTYRPLSGKTCKHEGAIIFSASAHHWRIHASAPSDALYEFNGLQVIGPGETDINVIAHDGITFSGRDELNMNGGSLTNCVIDNTAGTQAVTVTSQAELDDLANCSFTNNGIAITVDVAGSIALTADNITFSDNTVDVHYTGTGTLTWTNANGSNASIETSPTGTVVFVDPGTGIEFTGLVAGSQVVVCETGTQTEKYRDNNSSTSEDWDTTGDQGTVDYTIMKAGYIPIRATGVVVGLNKLTIGVEQIFDPVYEVSSGLTHSTHTSYNTGTSRLTLTEPTTIRNLYSAWIEFWIAEAAYVNKPFPLQAYGFNTIAFIDDAEFVADSHGETYITRGGWRYVQTDGDISAQWAGVQSVGTATGFTGEYQQVAGGTVTDALATGSFDQVIKVYGDATHGNFDRRGHLVLKYQPDGYRPAEVDVVSQYGTLFDTLYIVAMEPVLIEGLATGDPAPTGLSITNHGASPVTWNGKDFSITITDAGANSGATILQWLRYNCSLDATFEGQDPFNWPEMVVGQYETVRGTLWGSAGATLKGVRVVRGSDPHPDFSRFQSDDGTYFTPEIVSSISFTGMPTDGDHIRLQLFNRTAKTAPAWEATNAYAQGDMVLRTTGAGSEQTAGLFFRCTTAGTSGGTEPTWDTTVGDTTTDGTVTWTCYAILYFDGDPASSSYSSTYINGREFLAGEAFSYRFAEMNGATSFKLDDGAGIVSTSGISAAVSVAVDTVYAFNAVDGEAEDDKFSPNFVDTYIAMDTDTDYMGVGAYAYYCYTLTTSAGMYRFWGGVTALDVGNYRIEVDILDLYFDETIGFVKQLDGVRIFRSDGARPAIDPTTGGHGIEINWRNPVYPYDAGGGGFTETDRGTLTSKASATALAAAQTDITELKKLNALVPGTPVVITPTGLTAGTLTQTYVEDGDNITVTRTA